MLSERISGSLLAQVRRRFVISTYSYLGHPILDPGISYRNLDKVQEHFYKCGDLIPDIRVNYMGILAVMKDVSFITDYRSCQKKWAPLMLVISTNPYHGHYMSYHGAIYRTRYTWYRVQEMRQTSIWDATSLPT